MFIININQVVLVNYLALDFSLINILAFGVNIIRGIWYKQQIKGYS